MVLFCLICLDQILSSTFTECPFELDRSKFFFRSETNEVSRSCFFANFKPEEKQERPFPFQPITKGFYKSIFNCRSRLSLTTCKFGKKDKNERTKERKNERTKERKNERKKERDKEKILMN